MEAGKRKLIVQILLFIVVFAVAFLATTYILKK